MSGTQEPYEAPRAPGCRLLASVLVTGQQPSRLQRRGRYMAESMEHPGKMLPSIAATVIAAYSRPGEVILDPMCGIGTTLVEAVHLGRDAYGIEYEQRWAGLAAANLRLAVQQGARGTGRVVCGDARSVVSLVPAELRGRVSLVVTSPPYGRATHGHVRSTRDTGRPGVRKWNTDYTADSADRANLAKARLEELLDGFGRILAGCAQVLRPGGVVAVTVRPYRVRGELVDLPGLVAEVAAAAGLVQVDRLVALLCGIRGGRLVHRASFFQMLETRRARERGLPVCTVAHEDLLVFQAPHRLGPSEHAEEDAAQAACSPKTPCADPALGPDGRSGAETCQRIGLDERSRAERAYAGPATAGPGNGCGGIAPGHDGCGAVRPVVGRSVGGAEPTRRTDAHDTDTPPQPRTRPDGRTGDDPAARRGGGVW